MNQNYSFKPGEICPLCGKLHATAVKETYIKSGAINDLPALVKQYGADAGVMISASHNSVEYNGIKLFSGEGFKLSDETEACNQEVKESVSRYVTSQIGNLKKIVKTGQNYLSNCTDFMFNTFGDSPEFKIFVSNVTTNSISASFLIGFGCREFAAYSDIQCAQKELLNELEVYFN